MASFKKMHQFVTYVDAFNTKDNEEDDATLNNLVDENYYALKAIKEDNALRKFKEKFGYASAEVANIYKDAKEMGFLKRVTNADNSHVAGVAVFVEFKGRELIHKSKVLKLPTGKWLAWMNYYYKVLAVLAAFIGAALLDVLIRLLF